MHMKREILGFDGVFKDVERNKFSLRVRALVEDSIDSGPAVSCKVSVWDGFRQGMSTPTHPPKARPAQTEREGGFVGVRNTYDGFGILLTTPALRYPR